MPLILKASLLWLDFWKDIIAGDGPIFGSTRLAPVILELMSLPYLFVLVAIPYSVPNW
jgi:hypothetical protein